jgi:paraquat-inducible protein B
MSEQPGTSPDSGMPQKPALKKRHGISFIWILPLVAALIGAGLIFKSIIEAGIPIEIVFDSAEGIEAGKTRLMYRGLEVTRVTSVELNPDLNSVTVHLEVPRNAEKHLGAHSKFWLVKPEISLAGVSGLGTLVSGNYIAVQPGDGRHTRKFRALERPPPLDPKVPGLHIKVTSRDLGSLREGAPVYFRQIRVGRVQDHTLADDGESVIIGVYINPDYEHLVKKSSRFWNASGISISGGLSGLSIKTESIATVLSGGLAFNTPEDTGPMVPAEDGDEFMLYDDYREAEAGIKVTLRLENGEGLNENSTRIMFEGIEIGSINSIRVDRDLQGVIATADLDPRVKPFLTTGTQFWRVKPEISLQQISGLSTLLTGEYIAVQPGKGEPQYEFTVLEEAPILSADTPGLHFRLKANSLGSITRGTSIFYKKIPVGNVQAYTLDQQGKDVLIDVYIEEKFAQLVRKNTRFWNASGIELKGGIGGFKVRTESATSILVGGIAFLTPHNEKTGPVAGNGAMFTLYEDFNAATGDGTVRFHKPTPGLHIKVRTRDLGSLGHGSPVLYQRIPVGTVDSYELDQDDTHVLVNLTIKPRYRHLVHSNTRFWNASGIEVSGGLSGIHLKTESLKSILAGGIGFHTPDTPGPAAQNNAVFELYRDSRSAQEDSSPVRITFESTAGLASGAAIKYQGIQVGRVTGVQLEAGRDGVMVEADLFGSARHMATTGARFWVVGAELGLARTGNLETLITGNYIAMLPGPGSATTDFTGLPQAPEHSHRQEGLNLRLTAQRLGSIKPGNPVYYRQIPVGKVTGYALGAHADQVVIHINIEPYYTPLVRTNSEFWNASGIHVNAGLLSGLELDTESLESVLAGGIAFATPDNEDMGDAVEQEAAFELHDKYRNSWLSWQPKIPLGPAS